MRRPRRAGRAARAALLLALAAAPAGAQERFWEDAPAGAREPSLTADSYVALARRVRPALLTVEPEAQETPGAAPPPFGAEDGLGGSGFVIDPRGFALTSEHVVGARDEVAVRLLDGRQFPARVVGRDRDIDVALLQLQGVREALPFLVLGRSAEVRVGQPVVAFGSPYGLEGSLAVGVVGGLDRDLGASPFDAYLQVDARVSPGHSGGPLVNLRGEAVGINTAVVESARQIGFAVPIDVVRRFLPDLRSKGRIARAWVGIQAQDLTPELAESLGADGTAGALVTGTVPGSPAAQADIRPGDVVLALDGQAVGNRRTLQRAVARATPGREVAVALRRGGRRLEVAVRVGERGAAADAGAMSAAPSPLGLQAAVARGARLGTPPAEHAGLVVVAVSEGGPAERAGLRVGDVLLEAESGPGELMPLELVEDLSRVTRAFEEHGRVVVLYARGTQRYFVVVRR